MSMRNWLDWSSSRSRILTTSILGSGGGLDCGWVDVVGVYSKDGSSRCERWTGGFCPTFPR
jgi:hypothetical protein